MIKYKIKVEILKVDENGEQTWDRIRDEFEDENPFKARNKAIKRVKDLIEFFLVELSEQVSFSSVAEAKENELKKFNMFFLDLSFMDEHNWLFEIYGNTDEIVDGLAEEALFYKKNYPLKMVNRIDSLGNTVEVLESNIEFLLN